MTAKQFYNVGSSVCLTNYLPDTYDHHCSNLDGILGMRSNVPPIIVCMRIIGDNCLLYERRIMMLWQNIRSREQLSENKVEISSINKSEKTT